MSQFFRQLIELGEEQAPAEAAPQEDLSKASQQELLQHIRRVETKAAEQRTEYEKLQADSLSLRSEYDAYKRKVDAWQRQMKEARAADKKMIEELRAAGTTGKIDDVFLKTTQETIQNLKESLREAQEEVQKAFKKQREAEESRVAIEQSKKQELEALGQRFEALKERSRAHNEKLEAQLQEARTSTATNNHSGNTNLNSTIQQLRAQLESSERQRAELRRKLDRLSAASHRAEDDAAASTGDIHGDDVSASITPNTEAVPSQLLQSLQDENASLHVQLSQAASREVELQDRIRKAEEKLQRHLEDAQWEALEAGKKLAEAKTEVDMLKTRIAQLESKLEAKEEENAMNEKGSRRAIRDLEDALTLEKERHAADVHQQQQLRHALEQELQLERDNAAHHSELVGEAESASRKTAEALESQRRHFEKILSEKDATMQQIHGIRESLEVSVQESKEDLRRHMDLLDDVRRELDQAQERITELENQLLISQRCLNLREEDVQNRERERQKLRGQLRQEEDSVAKLRSVTTQLENRMSELEMELQRKDHQLFEAESAKSAMSNELNLNRLSMQELQKSIRHQDAHMQELNNRLQDQGIRNSDILRFREDQNVQIRNLERRNAELEAEMHRLQHEAVSASSDGSSSSFAIPVRNDGSVTSMSLLDAALSKASAVPAALIKKQFVTEAMSAVKQHRLLQSSLSNYRQLIVIAIFIVLLFSMFGGFHTTKEASSLTDIETINTLREKYGQSLMSAGLCREALSAAKEQIAGMCACTK